MTKTMSSGDRVLVTGGAGYIGCRLVPTLRSRGYRVRVLDAFLFGTPEDFSERNPGVEIVPGDIRDGEVVAQALRDTAAVIHLAAIANDPSADLDPKVTEQVNLRAVIELADAAKNSGIRRFVNASTATVYGVKDTPDVTEDESLAPITLYGKCKAESEDYVLGLADSGFTATSLRSATVCGVSPRLRLDLTVNILTHHAVRDGTIVVHGGKQRRPNIHIDDLVRAYVTVLEAADAVVSGQTFNVCGENHQVREIAELVRETLDGAPTIRIEEIFDHRSYHISAEKARRELNFTCRYSIADAVRALAGDLLAGRFGDTGDPRYYNLERMRQLGVK